MSFVSRKRHRVDPSATPLVPGQWLSRTSYMQIQAYDADTPPGNVRVRNEDGMEWTIGASIVAGECYAADSWSDEVRVSQTEMARALHDCGDLVFKARFTKADGSERVLVGRMRARDELMGRAQVLDLNVPRGEHAQRQIDYRTLHELVVGGVHYTLRVGKPSTARPRFVNGVSSS